MQDLERNCFLSFGDISCNHCNITNSSHKSAIAAIADIAATMGKYQILAAVVANSGSGRRYHFILTATSGVDHYLKCMMDCPDIRHGSGRGSEKQNKERTRSRRQADIFNS